MHSKEKQEIFYKSTIKEKDKEVIMNEKNEQDTLDLEEENLHTFISKNKKNPKVKQKWHLKNSEDQANLTRKLNKEYGINYLFKEDEKLDLYIEKISVLEGEGGFTEEECKKTKKTGMGVITGKNAYKKDDLICYFKGKKIFGDKTSKETAPFDYPVFEDDEDDSNSEIISGYDERNVGVFINGSNEPDVYVKHVYNEENLIVPDILEVRALHYLAPYTHITINYNEAQSEDYYFKNIDTESTELFLNPDDNSNEPGDIINPSYYTFCTTDELQNKSSKSAEFFKFFFGGNPPPQIAIPTLSKALLEYDETAIETCFNELYNIDKESKKTAFNAVIFGSNNNFKKMKPTEDPRPSLLHVAGFVGYTKVINTLLEVDFINLKKTTLTSGNTAWHTAMASPFLPLEAKINYYKLFRDKKLNAYLSNKEGKRPLDYLLETFYNDEETSKKTAKEISDIVKAFNNGIKKKYSFGDVLLTVDDKVNLKMKAKSPKKKNPEHEQKITEKTSIQSEEKEYDLDILKLMEQLVLIKQDVLNLIEVTDVTLRCKNIAGDVEIFLNSYQQSFVECGFHSKKELTQLIQTAQQLVNDFNNSIKYHNSLEDLLLMAESMEVLTQTNNEIRKHYLDIVKEIEKGKFEEIDHFDSIYDGVNEINSLTDRCALIIKNFNEENINASTNPTLSSLSVFSESKTRKFNKMNNTDSLNSVHLDDKEHKKQKM
jgi:hypothetical protein